MMVVLCVVVVSTSFAVTGASPECHTSNLNVETLAETAIANNTLSN